MKKKIFKLNNVFFALVVASMFFATNVSAQHQGDMAWGANLQVAGDATTLVGIGGTFQYHITDPIRLEGSLSLFLPNRQTGLIETTLNMWNLSVNGHFLLPLTENVTFYPLLGLGVANISATARFGSASATASQNYLGLNIGAGLDFRISENAVVNFEPRYLVTSEGNIYSVRIGVSFEF